MDFELNWSEFENGIQIFKNPWETGVSWAWKPVKKWIRWYLIPGYPHTPWRGSHHQHMHQISFHADLSLPSLHALTWTPGPLSHSTLFWSGWSKVIQIALNEGYIIHLGHLISIHVTDSQSGGKHGILWDSAGTLDKGYLGIIVPYPHQTDLTHPHLVINLYILVLEGLLCNSRCLIHSGICQPFFLELQVHVSLTRAKSWHMGVTWRLHTDVSGCSCCTWSIYLQYGRICWINQDSTCYTFVHLK